MYQCNNLRFSSWDLRTQIGKIREIKIYELRIEMLEHRLRKLEKLEKSLFSLSFLMV